MLSKLRDIAWELGDETAQLENATCCLTIMMQRLMLPKKVDELSSGGLENTPMTTLPMTPITMTNVATFCAMNTDLPLRQRGDLQSQLGLGSTSI